MDLHDYRDVAENYDRYLEVMYEHGDHHEHFQEFYLDLARKYGSGGVVDVACGTGAVLLYLAEHGVIADGTDLSKEMCRVRPRRRDLGWRARGGDRKMFAGVLMVTYSSVSRTTSRGTKA